MTVACLTRYGRIGGSSRVRCLQFEPELVSRGWQVRIVPFFDDEYVRERNHGRVSAGSVARAYWRRAGQQREWRDADVIWVEKEVWPWLPAWMDWRSLGAHTPVVVDYDDAWFHRYDGHRSRLVRAVLGRKIDAVMRRAAVVVAGNAYLADRARAAGAPRIEILPSVVDVARYGRASDLATGRPLTIGWIGSPATAAHLCSIAPVLARMVDAHGARVVAVGVRPDQVRQWPIETREWREDSEAGDLRAFDVGIMPLPDRPFERGKCAYKLLQYMASGMPVVASPVGVNAAIVQDGVTGLLATSADEWERALVTLMTRPQLRRAMADAGRAEVERSYSLTVAAPRLESILREGAATGARR